MSFTGARKIPTFETKYQGARILDYHNHHRDMPRDGVIASIMPQEVCSCSLARRGQPTCVREKTIERIADRLNIPRDVHVLEVMRMLMSQTKCTSEKCVIETAKKMHILSAAEAGIEEQIAFKQTGPTDISLFSDGVIHALIYAWMYQFHDFWAYNFNMLDYAQKSLRDGRVLRTPDTLASVSWADLYHGVIPTPVGMHDTPASRAMLKVKRQGIRCSTCIINSDVYDGKGKHWMALFVDARDQSAEPHWTIEFFNSAAIRPESEWLEWMVKTKLELEHINPRAHVELLFVCCVWHQHSRTECGPYSTFYTWARLNGVPAQYFIKNAVPDQYVMEFRQHVFENSIAKPGEKFAFEDFAKKVRVKWDSEEPGSNR